MSLPFIPAAQWQCDRALYLQLAQVILQNLIGPVCFQSTRSLWPVLRAFLQGLRGKMDYQHWPQDNHKTSTSPQDPEYNWVPCFSWQPGTTRWEFYLGAQSWILLRSIRDGLDLGTVKDSPVCERAQKILLWWFSSQACSYAQVPVIAIICDKFPIGWDRRELTLIFLRSRTQFTHLDWLGLSEQFSASAEGLVFSPSCSFLGHRE